jgi:transcriptional regulator with XRE-family HTH domain
MRRQAGLTQAQVAERLNTKQSAIARLEGDFDGGMSLRRYVDFALACGMVPHNITFAPLESVISYTIAQPKILYTQVNYQEWLKANSSSALTSVETLAQPESNSEVISRTLQTQREAVFSLEKSVGKGSTTSFNIASSVTTLGSDLSTKGYYQPYLIPPLQVLHGGATTSTAANQSHKEVAA